MRTKDDIVRIIQKLLRKTLENGCSPAEAAFATERVQFLLQKYQLSLVDVESKTLNEEMIKKVLDSGRKVRNPGECCLAQAIAEGCDVKLVVSHSPNYSYNFLGFISDVEVATYLYETLAEGLTKRATEEGRLAGATGPKMVRFRNNFLMGASGEIRRRLSEAKKQRQRDFEVSAAVQTTIYDAPMPQVSPRALMEIKQPQVEAFVKKNYTKLRDQSSIKVRTNFSALESGRAAGRQIPINQGIGVRRPDLVQ